MHVCTAATDFTPLPKNRLSRQFRINRLQLFQDAPYRHAPYRLCACHFVSLASSVTMALLQVSYQQSLFKSRVTRPARQAEISLARDRNTNITGVEMREFANWPESNWHMREMEERKGVRSICYAYRDSGTQGIQGTQIIHDLQTTHSAERHDLHGRKIHFTMSWCVYCM